MTPDREAAASPPGEDSAIPAARPVDDPGDLPVLPNMSIARPVVAGFPQIGMPRGSAALDVLLVAALVFAYQVLLFTTGIAWLLMELFPTVGILWPNLMTGTAVLVTIYIMLRLRGQAWSAAGLVRSRPLSVLGWAVAVMPLCYVAILIVVPMVMTVLGISMEDMLLERSEFFAEVPALPVAAAIAVAMFVGLHEEVLFRGFILGRLQSALRSSAGAIIASSVIFGLLHGYQGIIGVFQTGTVGIILGVLTVRTRTVWPAVLAHGMFDTVGLLLIPWLHEHFGDLLEEMATTSMPS